MQILKENTNREQFLSIYLERDAKLTVSHLGPWSANGVCKSGEDKRWSYRIERRCRLETGLSSLSREAKAGEGELTGQ